MINSCFDPQPYALLDAIIQKIYPSQSIHDELTYFSRFRYSTSIVVSFSNVSLVILPLAIIYLCVRLAQRSLYESYDRWLLRTAYGMTIVVISLGLYFLFLPRVQNALVQ
jgi:hypothetical protein